MSSFRGKVGRDPFNLLRRTKERIFQINQGFNIYIWDPDKGLISLCVIAVSHEIRENVVKKNWTLIAGKIAHVQAPYLCHDSCSDKTLSLSTTEVCLFVWLVPCNCSCNRIMMATGQFRPLQVQNCFGQSRGFRES